MEKEKNDLTESLSYFKQAVTEKEAFLKDDNRIQETEEGYMVHLKYEDILAYRKDAEKLKLDKSFDMTEKEKKERFYFFAMSLLGGYVDMIEETNNIYKILLEEEKNLSELEDQEKLAEQLIEKAKETRKQEIEEEYEIFKKKTDTVIQEMLMKLMEEEEAPDSEKELMLSKIKKLNNTTIKEYN